MYSSSRSVERRRAAAAQAGPAGHAEDQAERQQAQVGAFSAAVEKPLRCVSMITCIISNGSGDQQHAGNRRQRRMEVLDRRRPSRGNSRRGCRARSPAAAASPASSPGRGRAPCGGCSSGPDRRRLPDLVGAEDMVIDAQRQRAARAQQQAPTVINTAFQAPPWSRLRQTARHARSEHRTGAASQAHDARPRGPRNTNAASPPATSTRLAMSPFALRLVVARCAPPNFRRGKSADDGRCRRPRALDRTPWRRNASPAVRNRFLARAQRRRWRRARTAPRWRGGRRFDIRPLRRGR